MAKKWRFPGFALALVWETELGSVVFPSPLQWGLCVFWALSCKIRREVKRRRDVPRAGRGVWEARILERSTTGSDLVYREINRRGKTEFWEVMFWSFSYDPQELELFWNIIYFIFFWLPDWVYLMANALRMDRVGNGSLGAVLWFPSRRRVGCFECFYV